MTKKIKKREVLVSAHYNDFFVPLDIGKDKFEITFIQKNNYSNAMLQTATDWDL